MMHRAYIKHGDLWVHGDYAETLQDHELCDFDHLMAATGRESLNKTGLPGWRERVVLELDGPRGAQTFYLKRYTHPPRTQQISRMWQRYSSTAGIEWHWLQQATSLGITVPLAIAFGERRTALHEDRSLILTAPVAGVSLEKWLPGMHSAGLLDRNTKRNVSRAVAQLVARLHGSGLVHRDLYLSHVFIDDSTKESAQLSLIDLQRMIKPTFRRRRWIVKDLASLNYSAPQEAISATDRLRWFKMYFNIDRLGPKEKSLIRRIHDKSRRIARHSQKHGLG